MAGFDGHIHEINEPVDLQIIPYPAVTIFFDFGDAHIVDASGSGTSMRGIIGMASPALTARANTIDCLQLRLNPIAAHQVFGAPVGPGGSAIALDELWGRDAERIQDRLRTAGSWQERFVVAREEFGARVEAGPEVDREAAYVWRQMCRYRGKVVVDRLAAEVGWSRKRLWSRFRGLIGNTPKSALRLIRFDAAVHRLAAGHSASRVAAAGGYTDQSHLYREVKDFVGLTPNRVADAAWLAIDDVAWTPSRA